ARQSAFLPALAGRRVLTTGHQGAMVVAVREGSGPDAAAAMSHHLDRVATSLDGIVRPPAPADA
ncbi:GntR family transcriptional regulator, partial [Streptomyces sp. NPDC059575]